MACQHRRVPDDATFPTLTQILTLEAALGEDGAGIPGHFVGHSPPERRARVFGGQVVAQALVAATETTVADHHVHSLHAYFLRGGDVDEPIGYVVERLRDGRSFSARRVTALQRGEAILVLSSSFHAGGPSGDHEPPAPVGIPGPEHLPPTHFAKPGVFETRDPRIVTSGRILDGDGRSVATVAQEVLAREPAAG